MQLPAFLSSRPLWLVACCFLVPEQAESVIVWMAALKISRLFGLPRCLHGGYQLIWRNGQQATRRQCLSLQSQMASAPLANLISTVIVAGKQAPLILEWDCRSGPLVPAAPTRPAVAPVSQRRV